MCLAPWTRSHQHFRGAAAPPPAGVVYRSCSTTTHNLGYKESPQHSLTDIQQTQERSEHGEEPLQAQLPGTDPSTVTGDSRDVGPGASLIPALAATAVVSLRGCPRAVGVIMPARKRLARVSLFSITACTLPSRLPGGPWLTCLLSIICF